MAGAGIEQPCQTLKSSFESSLQSLSLGELANLQKGLEKADAYGIEALGLFGSMQEGSRSQAVT